jgi:hypothetical protein
MSWTVVSKVLKITQRGAEVMGNNARWALLLIILFCCLLPIPLLAVEPPADPPITVYIPEYTEPDPILVIADDRWMPVFEAGSKAQLNIPIKNVGGRAYNTVISLNVSDPKSLPFEADKMAFNRYISSFTGQTVYSIPITIPANTAPGTYPLQISANYQSASGGGGSASATVYIKITSDLRQPQLKLLGLQMEGDKLKAGSTQVVKLNLKNDSDIPINSINLRLNGFSTEGINLDNWPDTQFVKAMEAGELHPVEFRLQAGSKMESGTYPLDLAIEFQDQYHHKYTQEQKVYVPVAGKGEQDDLLPRILLEDYYLGDDYVQAGQTFPLTLLFRNTSKNTAVANIKVSLSSEGDIFAPVGSSSSFYFPEISPGEAVEHTIRLHPQPNAEHKVYSLVAQLDYQDEDGNQLKDQETISLPVVKEIKLVTSDVEISPEVYMGSPTSITLDLYNTGRSTVRNLMITTEGDFEVQNGTLFIGNLEAGHDDYYDATLVPAQEGELPGKVIISYEDELGQPYQLEKAFTLTVMPAAPPPMFGPEMPLEETAQSPLKKWMIAGGILLLLATVITIILIRRRHHRRMKEVELDE